MMRSPPTLTIPHCAKIRITIAPDQSRAPVESSPPREPARITATTMNPTPVENTVTGQRNRETETPSTPSLRTATMRESLHSQTQHHRGGDRVTSTRSHCNQPKATVRTVQTSTRAPNSSVVLTVQLGCRFSAFELGFTRLQIAQTSPHKIQVPLSLCFGNEKSLQRESSSSGHHGKSSLLDKANVKRGPWSPEEDATLKSYVETHGTGRSLVEHMLNDRLLQFVNIDLQEVKMAPRKKQKTVDGKKGASTSRTPPPADFDKNRL